MLEVINFIGDHWEPIVGVVGALVGLVFGTKYREAKDLIRTVQTAWEDKQITPKELEDIKADINKLLGRK